MAYDLDLLPGNASDFELAFSEAVDLVEVMGDPIEAINYAKLVTLPDSFLPYLIYEYGLGSITPYVTDQREAIELGIPWQRLRGTPAALHEAMSWIGFDTELYEVPARRARWNLFHLDMGAIPELSDLEGINTLAGLSVPVRSRFWRGFYGYDIRPLEWSYRRWSGSAYSQSSGVRVEDGGPLWSFGELTEIDGVFPMDDLIQMGVWVYPDHDPTEGWGIGFFALSDLDNVGGWTEIAWEETPETWESFSGLSREYQIAAAILSGPIFAAFRDASGDLIGYRRARIARGVVKDASGLYELGSSHYSEAADPTSIYFEFFTDEGDGDGQVAASVSLIIGAETTDPDAPGQLWLPPGGLTGGTEGTPFDVSITFSQITRQRLRLNLKI